MRVKKNISDDTTCVELVAELVIKKIVDARKVFVVKYIIMFDLVILSCV